MPLLQRKIKIRRQDETCIRMQRIKLHLPYDCLQPQQGYENRERCPQPPKQRVQADPQKKMQGL